MKLFIITILSMLATGASACGADTDCVMGDRHYRIAMPDGHDGKTAVGAIVFAHGYRGSAAGMMRNTGFRKRISDEGLALIALNARKDAWSLPNSPSKPENQGLSELDYLHDVLDHASAQFPIDRSDLIMTGFSAGGMMVWTTLCHASELFTGYIPISGTFWSPIPDTCETAVKSVIHIHGDNDKTVPLSGRQIGEAKQGDVAKAIAMYQKFGGFDAVGQEQRNGLQCDLYENGDAKVLQFCMFEGGHSFQGKHVTDALNVLKSSD